MSWDRAKLWDGEECPSSPGGWDRVPWGLPWVPKRGTQLSARSCAGCGRRHCPSHRTPYLRLARARLQVGGSQDLAPNPKAQPAPGEALSPPTPPPRLPVWVLGHREPLELLASRLQGVPGRGPSQRGSPRQSFGEVRGAPRRRRPLLSCVTASPAPGLPVLTRGWGRGWPRPRIPIGTGTRPPVPLGRDGARQGGGRSPPPSHGCCHHRGTRAAPGVLGEAQHPSPGRLWGQPG